MNLLRTAQTYAALPIRFLAYLTVEHSLLAYNTGCWRCYNDSSCSTADMWVVC